MFKFKAVINSLVLAIVIITQNLSPVLINANEFQPAKEFTTTSKLKDCTLTWTNVDGSKILSKVTKDNADILYTYSANKNRISKKSGDNIVKFTYDNNSRLISEVRGKITLTYQYDYSNSLIGFTVNNARYNFIKDYDLNIIAITDTSNNEVARYEYGKDGIVSAILGKDEAGKWTDMSDNGSFIGTLNLIRLHSYYYDAETGWYYNGYQYYDSNKNEYAGGTDNLNSISTFEDFLRINNIATPMVSPDLVMQITNWKNTLMNTSTFGNAITYSSGWYNSLSDVELLSRLFYGENTLNSFDQDAVTWIVINRKNDGSFGNTYRAIAIKPSQFEPITGGEGGTTNARVPDTSNSQWGNAVWSACTLLSTSSLQDYTDLIPKPTGITTQLYFVGLSYFLSYFSNGNPISKDAVPTGTGLTYSYNSGSSYVKIKDVLIVFDRSNTFQNPGSKSAITNYSDLNTPGLRATHNIFYNYQ